MKYVITPAHYTFEPETDFERKVLGYFAQNFCETKQPETMVGGSIMPFECPNCGSKDFENGKCSICMCEIGPSMGQDNGPKK